MRTETMEKSMRTETIEAAALAATRGAWEGWDWAHAPATCRCRPEGEPEGEQLVLDGPGAVEDWGAWERARSAALRAEGHTETCARACAQAEREYGEEVQLAASDAADAAREALAHVRGGRMAAALAAIRQAAAAEREYGDASVYGPAVRAVEAAADGE